MNDKTKETMDTVINAIGLSLENLDLALKSLNELIANGELNIDEQLRISKAWQIVLDSFKSTILEANYLFSIPNDNKIKEYSV
jgi:hypothetical protein